MTIDRDELVRLTEEYGGTWGIEHTRRLLRLVEIIGQGQTYDAGVVWVAAHLHDWGGYAPWLQKGVDHARRSGEVAAEFLAARGVPEDFSARVLEGITSHHSPDPGRNIEAILLCDADALDFLGVVGALRDFSKNARDLRAGYEATRKRRQSLPDRLILPASKALGAGRLLTMDALLAAFERETFGCF